MLIAERIQLTIQDYVNPILNHPKSKVVCEGLKEVAYISVAGSFLYISQFYLRQPLPSIRTWAWLNPIIEEVTFRGILQRGIKLIQKAKNTHYNERPTAKDLKVQQLFRVNVTAVLFGVYTGYNSRVDSISNLLVVSCKTIEGMTLGYLSEKYKTLSIGILANGMNKYLVQTIASSLYIKNQLVTISLIAGTSFIHLIGYQFATLNWDEFKKSGRKIALQVAYCAATLVALHALQFGILACIPRLDPRLLLFQNVLIPFIEEFIFRGIIQKGIEYIQNTINYVQKKELTETDLRIQKGIRVGISSILFGLAHSKNPGYPVMVIAAGIVGIGYGYVAEKYQSLAPTILSHGIHNSLMSCLTFSSKSFRVVAIPLAFSLQLVGCFIATNPIEWPDVEHLVLKTQKGYNQTFEKVHLWWKANFENQEIELADA